MAAYQLSTGTQIIRQADGARIPNDPTNHDYQDYLTWVAFGNTADPYVAPVDSAAVAALKQLQQNDAAMFRALELLIDVLLAKGVIVATDFTPAVRTLYQARKALRATAGVA